MGQDWIPVNLDRKEFVYPHDLASGLKVWEQLANHPGTAAALIVLCAAQREVRGFGDFDMTDNWHGPERTYPAHNTSPGPMPEDYPTVARRTIGRWAGDRVALVGDYAEDGDLAPEHEASTIYGAICEARHDGIDNGWRDVTADVCRVIEHELLGRFVGEGWRDFEPLRTEQGA